MIGEDQLLSMASRVSLAIDIPFDTKVSFILDGKQKTAKLLEVHIDNETVVITYFT